jgi:ABC-type thiamine transport system substrate-binding protein
LRCFICRESEPRADIYVGIDKHFLAKRDRALRVIALERLAE